LQCVFALAELIQKVSSELWVTVGFISVQYFYLQSGAVALVVAHSSKKLSDVLEMFPQFAYLLLTGRVGRKTKEKCRGAALTQGSP
jgi:hypothetical protein